MPGYDPLRFSWRTRAGVTIARDPADRVRVTVDDGEPVVLSPGSGELADAMVALDAGAGLSEDAFVRAAGSGAGELARAYYALTRFISNGLLVCAVSSEARVLATMIPRRRDFAIGAPPLADTNAILPRFAFLRRIDDALVLSCPGAGCELALHGSEPAGGFAAAAEPVGLEQPDGSQDTRSALYRLALAHGLLEAVDRPEAPAQASWEFHDRLFHHAARWFDDLIPRGGTFRFTDRFPSPPAVRATHPGRQRALDPVVVADSRPLHEVMERRRSRREMGDRPVTAAAVAEVMWRVARTTGTAREGPQDTIRRPYPSGGSLHELEFYLAISACDGLPPGFYHYRGDAHALTELDAPGRATEGLLANSAAAWGQAGEPPQVLVVIASRLPRLAWKYTAIAYKVSLLNAGAAIQSLYLVTTDLGLAGSAMGSGDPGLFEQATGCDPFEETSIAEFGFGAPAART
jgi:SagB-type dehydrogenase family enzyme